RLGPAQLARAALDAPGLGVEVERAAALAFLQHQAALAGGAPERARLVGDGGQRLVQGGIGHVKASIVVAEHDGDAAAPRPAIGNAAEAARRADARVLYLALAGLAAQLRHRLDQRHETADGAARLAAGELAAVGGKGKVAVEAQVVLVDEAPAFAFLAEP